RWGCHRLRRAKGPFQSRFPMLAESGLWPSVTNDFGSWAWSAQAMLRKPFGPPSWSHFRPEKPPNRAPFMPPLLHQQHAIAVAEKAVFFAHGFGVGAEDQLASGEGAHQHEQRGLRQVEIGQQRAHRAEFIRRVNKNARLVRIGGDLT